MAEPGRRPKIDIPFADEAEIIDFVERFEQCRWPYERWTHRAHLAVAAAYLRRLPFDEALKRVQRHIDLYNRTCGDPDGYHETLTVFFMRLVARRMADRPGDGLAAVVEELARTCDMRRPLEHYSAERLWSPQAKTAWAEPDLKPLDF